MGYTPHVVVVGGGLIGTATARDLAMRGLDVTLVERGTLASGATGGVEGLLESGARYAVSDEKLASLCGEERETLREIASHCIEETGGLFVQHSTDDPEQYERVRDAASEAGISVEEFSGVEIREREPALSAEVERGFEVPAGTVDPDRLTVATARSAREYGATVLTRTEVTDLLVEDGALTGVEVVTPDGETGTIQAQYVVNAAGASVGEVAEAAGIEVPVESSNRLAVVMDDRPTDRAVRRLRPGSADETVAPRGPRTALGMAGPDSDAEGAVECVDQTIDALDDVLRDVADSRFLRASHPVHAEYATGGDDGGSFGHSVLDHDQRDDVWGLSTVFGGTLTTHRLLAEKVATQICEKFGIDRPSHTGSTPLPGSESDPDDAELAATLDLDNDVLEASVRRLGGRAGEVLATDGPNPVVCQCEGVTRAEVKDALSDGTAQETDLEAVRVRTGAGRGSCMGGRCVHRLASPLYLKTGKATIEGEVESFLQNRWEDQRGVLWGDQLAQAMETYALHATTMSRDNDPGEVDLDQFDSGPEWDDEVDPYGGLAP